VLDADGGAGWDLACKVGAPFPVAFLGGLWVPGLGVAAGPLAPRKGATVWPRGGVFRFGEGTGPELGEGFEVLDADGGAGWDLACKVGAPLRALFRGAFRGDLSALTSVGAVGCVRGRSRCAARPPFGRGAAFFGLGGGPARGALNPQQSPPRHSHTPAHTCPPLHPLRLPFQTPANTLPRLTHPPPSRQLVAYRPSDRPSAAAALAHPWLSDAASAALAAGGGTGSALLRVGSAAAASAAAAAGTALTRTADTLGTAGGSLGRSIEELLPGDMLQEAITASNKGALTEARLLAFPCLPLRFGPLFACGLRPRGVRRFAWGTTPGVFCGPR
jgi:hypothetical protein